MRNNLFASPRGKDDGLNEGGNANNRMARSRANGPLGLNSLSSPIAHETHSPPRRAFRRFFGRLRRDPALLAAIVMGLFAIFFLLRAMVLHNPDHGTQTENAASKFLRTSQDSLSRIETSTPASTSTSTTPPSTTPPSTSTTTPTNSIPSIDGTTPSSGYEVGVGIREQLVPTQDPGSSISSPPSRTFDFPPEFRRTRKFQSLESASARSSFSHSHALIHGYIVGAENVFKNSSPTSSLLSSPSTLVPISQRASRKPTPTPAQHQPVDVHAVYPHSSSAFTQGFEVLPEELQLVSSPTSAGMTVIVESTGLYGLSTLTHVDLDTGKELKRVSLPSNHFGEGLTIRRVPLRHSDPHSDRVVSHTNQFEIFVLTWREGVCHVYNAETLKLIRTMNLPNSPNALNPNRGTGTGIGIRAKPVSVEGWGLAVDKDAENAPLILSDGTSTLRWLDADTFQVLRQLTVTEFRLDEFGTGAFFPIHNINELEFSHGKILANVWFSSKIAVIDPDSGRVERWIDCSKLHAKAHLASLGSAQVPPSITNNSRSSNSHKVDTADPNAVFNGIAYDEKNDRLLVTGKLWDAVYSIRIADYLDNDSGTPDSHSLTGGRNIENRFQPQPQPVSLFASSSSNTLEELSSFPIPMGHGHGVLKMPQIPFNQPTI